jgi:hypothetical protein
MTMPLPWPSFGSFRLNVALPQMIPALVIGATAFIVLAFMAEVQQYYLASVMEGVVNLRILAFPIIFFLSARLARSGLSDALH